MTLPLTEEQQSTQLRDRGEALSSGFSGFSTDSVFFLGRRQAWNDLKSSLPLIVLDTFSVVSAVAAANALELWYGLDAVTFDAWFMLGAIVLVLLAQTINGLYPGCGLNYSIEFRSVLRTSLIVSAGLAVGLVTRDPLSHISWLGFAEFSLLLFFLLSNTRPIARRILLRFDWWLQPAVIIGSSSRATALYDRINQNQAEGIRPVGIVCDMINYWDESEDESENEVAKATSSSQFIGPLSELEAILVKLKVCRVFVADIDNASEAYKSFCGIPRVTLLTQLGPHPTEMTRMTECDGQIEFHCRSSLTSPCSILSKRSIDLLLVITAMPLWIPLATLIALAIRFTDPGPIFYRQLRVGRFGIPFEAIKFRSMVLNADQRLRDYIASNPAMREEWLTTHKLRNDPRVTRIGNFLRKSSLDELPQLWNVLVGDMSLVGPRPIIDGSDYDREYIQDHPEVFELYTRVRPGVTGMWQISGRNSLPYKQRVYLDRFYLHNWSLSLDFFILWRTIKTALLREGAF